VGEHQTYNSVIFSIQHCSENTALCTENIAKLVTCIINFEWLKVAETNNLLARNALNQLKYCQTHLGEGLKPNTALGFASYCISLSPTSLCFFSVLHSGRCFKVTGYPCLLNIINNTKENIYSVMCGIFRNIQNILWLFYSVLLNLLSDLQDIQETTRLQVIIIVIKKLVPA